MDCGTLSVNVSFEDVMALPPFFREIFGANSLLRENSKPQGDENYSDWRKCCTTNKY